MFPFITVTKQLVGHYFLKSHQYCETQGCREMTSWLAFKGLFYLSHRKG